MNKQQFIFGIPNDFVLRFLNRRYDTLHLGAGMGSQGTQQHLIGYGLIGIIKRDDRAILDLELALESDIDLLLANGGFISDRSQLAIIID